MKVLRKFTLFEIGLNMQERKFLHQDIFHEDTSIVLRNLLKLLNFYFNKFFKNSINLKDF